MITNKEVEVIKNIIEEQQGINVDQIGQQEGELTPKELISKANIQVDTEKITKQANSQLGYQQIPIVYIIAVTVLGTLALLTAVGGLIVLFQNPTGTGKMVVPESLVAIGSASVGALVGLFAPSPGNNTK